MIKLKKCLKEPIQEIFEAAKLLDDAANAHIEGDYNQTERLILKADMPEIRDWTESIWGAGGVYTELKKKLGEPETFPKELRAPLRMPNKTGEIELLKRDGFKCSFCGIPVIRKEVRVYLNKFYPNALKWGKTNTEQHSAFQAMWVQYDHIIPHARGGETNLENMVITCAPCNYGRMNFLLEEIGISMPNLNKSISNEWDGLERLLDKKKHLG
jgi:hypothetical protein